ncbi:MAG: DUF4389 domain-containing protein [Pseudomonadota bacterium]|nr:DUF4389 domain-containing protein [Pseudomonadota bacterium]
MNENHTPNLLDVGHWLRLLLMLLFFAAVFYVAKFIITIAMLVQWVIVLFAGTPNERLRGFTAQLNRFSYQSLQFLTFNSDERPFPFSEWPTEE